MTDTEVTEADRLLYVELMEAAGRLRSDLCGDAIMRGEWDHDTGMQIIAKHRLAHTRAGGAEPVGMRVLLPPASIDNQDYLEGWCEGQSYLILNYGNDAAFEQAVADTERLTHPAPDADLVEALRPFAECAEQIGDDEDDEEWAKFRLLIKNYRAARAALRARGIEA